MMRAAVWGLALLLLGEAAAEAVEAVWIGPEVGAWNVAANWSTGTVPNFSMSARIDDDPAQNSRVESRTSASVGLLTIDAGDTLAVINSPINVARPLVLDGTISVEGSGQLSAGLILRPGSELRLNGSNATAMAPLFNEGDIHGGGRLNLETGTTSVTRYNQSTIRADNPTIPLTLQLSSNANFENNGRLTATGGGRLQITRSTIFGDGFGIIGGRIEAHPASTVSMQAYTYVEDVVLALVDDENPLTSAPIFQFSNSELKDVTLEGSFKLSGATILGSLRNTGELTQGTTSHVHNDLDGEVLLTGGGTVNLRTAPALFAGTEGADRLINVDNVIRGQGELLVSWVGFENRHIVQADGGQNAELVFYNGLSDQLLVNSGVMKAINGGRLRLAGFNQTAIMENFEGTDAGEIIAEENSSVLFDRIHIKGGVLRTAGNDPATRGKFFAASPFILDNVTLQGHFRFETLAGNLPLFSLNGKISNQGSMTGRFSVGLSAELAGGGEIIGEAGPFFSLVGNPSSIVNVDNFIHGSGDITTSFTNSRFTNRGTLRSDGLITVSSTLDVVNRGRLEAGRGAQLDLPSIDPVLNYEDGVDGVIHAADGGVVNFSRIDGGILSTEGSGVIRSRSTGFIKDVHNKGTLEVNAITAQGNILNEGVIKGSLRLSSPFVRFEGDGTWDAFGSTIDGGLLINGPQHTILGIGNFAAATPVTVVVNEGTLRAKEGTVFNIFALSFENIGLVHAPPGRTLGIGSSLGRAENRGTLQVDGNMGFHAPPGLYNEGGGTIDVRGGLTLEETVLRNSQGGLLTGSGSILGPTTTTTPVVENQGRIAPGSGIATLTIQGNFEQLASGLLEMEVAAGEMPASDLLSIDGTASLAGMLQVSLIGDDPLAVGDSFTVLTATEGVAGTFDELLMPALDDTSFWKVQYLANAVRATVTEVIPGDFNRSGSIDAADYVVWRKNGGEAAGYNDWRAHFGETVNFEEPLSSAQVPEPTSGWMVLACGAMILASFRYRSRKLERIELSHDARAACATPSRSSETRRWSLFFAAGW